MFDEIIEQYSKMFEVDKFLVYAIIKKESSWNPWAIRIERGFWTRYMIGIKELFFKTPQKDDKWLAYPDLVSASYGLMQLMLSTAMELGFRFQYPTELLKPENNIKYGCVLLQRLHNRYGEWTDAISAYNQGNNKKKFLSDEYKNQEYVDDVVEFWSLYKKVGK